MDINRTMLVEKTRVELARTMASILSTCGAGMFVVPAYLNGQIEYYISSGWIAPEWDSVLPLDGSSQAVKDAAAQALFTALQGAATIEQCADIINTSIIVDCCVTHAHATLERLGLTLQPE